MGFLFTAATDGLQFALITYAVRLISSGRIPYIFTCALYFLKAFNSEDWIYSHDTTIYIHTYIWIYVHRVHIYEDRLDSHDTIIYMHTYIQLYMCVYLV